MKNKTVAITLKAIALAVSWLTLSPLLLILDGRWKLLPKWLRILLFFLSPLMLIIIVIAVILGDMYYSDFYARHHFVKPKVIENITGVRLPDYKVVEYERGPRFFNGDYTDEFVLEFDRIPDDDFYKKLEEQFDCFEPGKYSFGAIWGNGMEAPKGESDKDDIGFSIDIERGSKTFHVSVSEW